MFFKGTERRPSSRDLTTLIDGIGGEFNAFTSKEYTGYYVRCAGADRDTALDVLLDMLRHSKFDPEEIEREKGVILEEMNMYQDTPRDHIGTVYETLMFGDNPLGWETLGTKETIRGANRETFLDYVDEWYTPERMVVGVSGMVGDDLAPMLEELLGDLQPNGDRKPAPAELDRAPGPARRRPPQGRRAGAPDPRRAELPDRAPRPLRAADALGRPRLRDVLAPLPRGARAPRPRLLRPRHEPLLHRRRLAARAGGRRHQPHRRGDQGDRRAVRAHGRRDRALRRAREVARDDQGPLRPPHRGAAGADHVRPEPRGARGRGARARGAARRRSTRSPPRTSSASRRT